MDSTIVDVALPTLGRELHTGTDTLDDAGIAYLGSLAVLTDLRMARGSPRRASGAVGSTALLREGSALCGSATSLGELVAFRVLQGIGDALS